MERIKHQNIPTPHEKTDVLVWLYGHVYGHVSVTDNTQSFVRKPVLDGELSYTL